MAINTDTSNKVTYEISNFKKTFNNNEFTEYSIFRDLTDTYLAFD